MSGVNRWAPRSIDNLPKFNKWQTGSTEEIPKQRKKWGHREIQSTSKVLRSASWRNGELLGEVFGERVIEQTPVPAKKKTIRPRWASRAMQASKKRVKPARVYIDKAEESERIRRLKNVRSSGYGQRKRSSSV